MASVPGQIVVVDDDPSLRQMVIRYLEDHNIPTKPASNRTEFNRHFGLHPSLIILDLRLGQDDGLDMLREIRSHSDVPVIITTGHRPDEIDRIVGLELGADDYIVKPFSLRELLARVRAVLRRQEMDGSHAPTIRSEADTGSTAGNSSGAAEGCSTRMGRGRAEQGRVCLLLAFLEAPQRPLSREQLLQARGYTRIFSIEASMSRCCGCGASSRSIRVRRASSRPSAASAIFSRSGRTVLNRRCDAGPTSNYGSARLRS